MTNSSRLTWIITALVALGLLAATVALALRDNSLPAVEAPTSTTTAEQPDATPDAVVAPSGPAANGLIAFVSDRDGNSEIYVTQADGSNLTRITDDPAEDAGPNWSLDGRQLYWMRIERPDNAPVQWTLHAANPDGSQEHSVLAGDGWPMGGAQNPASSQAIIAVVEDANENREPDEEDTHRLLLFDFNQPEIEPVDLLAGLEGVTPSPYFQNSVYQWSPDGAAIYLLLTVNGDHGLYALPLGGGAPQLAAEGQVQLAALSPDGQQLALWREIEDTGRRRRRLFLHQVETGDETPFLMGGLSFQTIQGLAWNLAGDHLVFSGFTGASAPNIFVLETASDQAHALSQQVPDPAFQPAWSPDGRQVVFTAQAFRAAGQSFEPTGDSEMYVVDDLGSNPTRLTENQGNNTDPAWQPLYQ